MPKTRKAARVDSDAKRDRSGDDSSGTSLDRPRIAILIVAYNAVSTLRAVLDRVPESVWDAVEEVVVFDDSSGDDTYLLGLGYKTLHGHAKLSVFRNEENLGYGGNQMRGYRYVIDKGYDIVALLHGDGQYAPELLPELLAPVLSGEADAVFGSRMMPPSRAREGGMPMYKFVGNRILTAFENAALGASLSEFHSGYRVYATSALSKIPFEQNSPDFHFDTQIIIQLLGGGFRILEIPIPTFYGDEISRVNGLRYAKDVVKSVIEYKLHELGLAHKEEYELDAPYRLKRGRFSSHSQILQMVGSVAADVLDVGCGTGELAGLLAERGHRVACIEKTPPRVELDAFYAADLHDAWPVPDSKQFDVIIMADVLEHLVDPGAVLERALSNLRSGGRVIISLPNAVHWSVRGSVLFGRFDYSNQGILDRTHLRFFSRASAERLFARVGLRVEEHRSTTVPWERVVPFQPLRVGLERLDHMFGFSRPNLFAYQHVFSLKQT